MRTPGPGGYPGPGTDMSVLNRVPPRLSRQCLRRCCPRDQQITRTAAGHASPPSYPGERSDQHGRGRLRSHPARSPPTPARPAAPIALPELPGQGATSVARARGICNPGASGSTSGRRHVSASAERPPRIRPRCAHPGLCCAAKTRSVPQASGVITRPREHFVDLTGVAGVLKYKDRRIA